MAFPTAVRRGLAVSSTTNTASWTPSFTFTSLNTAVASGERVLWRCYVAVDGNGGGSLSETSGSGWAVEKYDANGIAAAGALFTLETTGAYAASAFPAITITLAAGTEQYSAIMLASKVASGATIGTLTATSTNGSSTNSNPPAITNSSGAARDVQVDAFRAGDAQVVATIAPTNYGNLLTQAGASTTGASSNTAERQINIANGGTEDPGTFTSVTEQWATITFGFYEIAAAGGGATLTAAGGTYAVTGSTAALRRNVPVVAAGGSYSLTGKTATLSRQIKIIAVAGAYALAGTAASLRRAVTLAAVSGSYAVTGKAATLSKGAITLLAAAGSYIVTGTAAALKAGYRIFARSYTGATAPALDPNGFPDPRTYTLTGSTAALLRGTKVLGAAGSYLLNGAAALLNSGLRLTGGSGAHVYTGTQAALLKGNRITAGGIAYAVTGKSAALKIAYRVPASPGAYALVGSLAGLTIGTGSLNYTLPAIAGAYVLTPAAVQFRRPFPPFLILTPDPIPAEV